MTARYSTAARNAALNAVAALIDAGSGAGKIRVYTGTQPAGGPADAATGVLLAEIPFADPSFGAAASGSISADVDPVLTANASNTGTAGWARVLDSNNTAIVDGSVTATGGGGEFTFNTTAFTSGVAVTITGGTLTQAGS